MDKRSGYASNNQKSTLFELMKKHPQLLCGKFTNFFTKKEAQKQWEEIANILNSIPGGKKKWCQWRKTWQDYRSKAKKQKAAISRHQQGTGGGPATMDTLSKTDEAVLELINPLVVTGHEDVKESTTDFNFESILDIAGSSSDTQALDITKDDVIVNDCEIVVNDHDYNELPNISQKIEFNIHNEEPLQGKSTPTTVRKYTPLKAQRLQHTVSAAENLNKTAQEKLAEKKEYHRKKLSLMENKIVEEKRHNKLMEDLAKTKLEVLLENKKTEERHKKMIEDLEIKKVETLLEIQNSLSQFLNKH